MTPVFDTAVIGGGLAGTSAAITLAQQGARVLLLEAKAYPHHKVCGEFLSPVCMGYLGRLGVQEAVEAVHPAAITATRITSPRGVIWNSALPGTGTGITRYTLDHLLADHAARLGVCVQEKTRVLTVEGDLTDGFTLTARSEGQEVEFQARTVIGAHGKRSTLDRTLARPFLNRQHPFIGLKAHFYGPPLHQRVELHTFPGGYCGISEVEEGQANVCLLVRQPVFQEAGAGDIERFITWMQAQNPHLARWLAQAERVEPKWLSISQVPFSSKRAVEGDILMTGDAAGLIAPLAGDGMEMALRGGEMAAVAVSRFLGDTWSAERLRRQYRAEWRRVFGRRLRLAHGLQAAILNPHVLAPGLHLLNRFPALGAFIVTHTRDMRLPVMTGGLS
ncbi:MAG: NAD(P)/FAD-dependent oxidoreductase [Anaerolineae bacterium]